MECRPLDITVASGKGLKDVNLIGKMDVYCVVSIKGDPHKSKQKQKTNVHQDCGPNPVWNYPMKFTIDEAAAQQNRLQIKFKLVAERMMGDKDVGVVSVPVKELLDSKDGKRWSRELCCQDPIWEDERNAEFLLQSWDIMSPSLPTLQWDITVVLGQVPPTHRLRLKQRIRVLIPIPISILHHPNKAMGDTHLHPDHGYQGYPPQPGYGGYPQQPGYGGYPPAMQQQKPKKSGKGNMALGLGAGLLGGLLVGEMISDVGDAASFDDGGFDF
ncbi:INGRESSION PROTEIN FIC1 [Salix purpurea]|uniref:INGRESSION PROTEIN FIC1 n=1 Tax=Salix purpurea TaxID=77065 RepID=A0A9Q1A8X2_SALPP|nr:INGRESSION PROTEIN FIC1 [Salix purpurea]